MRIYKKPRKPYYMTALARDMRKNPTPSEKVLWEALRERIFFGYHLRRQAPFGRYIFDIYCAKKKIAFEIDGSSHEDKKGFDRNRDADLAGSMVKVVRFSDDDVMNNIGSVLERIRSALERGSAPPSPALPPVMVEGSKCKTSTGQ